MKRNLQTGFDHGDSRGNRGSYRDGDVQVCTLDPLT